MADCSAIKARLDDALAAYDRLLTGRSVRLVWDSDRSRIEYTQADRGDLYAYIARLQIQYNACVGAPVVALTKPINFVF